VGEAAGRVHRAGRYVFAHGIAGNGADPAENLRRDDVQLELEATATLVDAA
jgi:hypothetical protein